ncbi:hypothetical protein HJD18_09810 [Thermoleophilia bacterium SCSIO 60948]|nr:hypothetical protein HJD18_09810 [Thermoleophilia bacterium SCSIO 60948]
MKDQYVSDVNDYLKYGLLRAIVRGTPSKRTLYVCWMLTEDDQGPDGRKLGYLDDPEKFRGNDPVLFDELVRLVRQDQRSVRSIADSPVLPAGTVFHSDIIRDDFEGRSSNLRSMLERRPSKPIVFFDPDNGIEVESEGRAEGIQQVRSLGRD